MRCISAAAMPVATAAVLPNSEWIHGSCHEVSGYGVENTSRQPVALAATTGSSIALRIILTTTGAVQPAHSGTTFR